MSKSLFIATLEPSGGKSVVALGIMELLSRRLHNIGFFRPIIPDVDCDNNIQLILNRYNLNSSHEDMYAYKHEDARRMVSHGQSDVLLKNILDKYKALESRCDFVLCEGTDYTGVTSAFEFDFNAGVANDMGCPIIAVVNGRSKSPQEILDATRFARDAFESQGCTILAILVNRVEPQNIALINAQLKDETFVKEPVYLLPEEPLLGKPTVGEIAAALKSRRLQGDPEDLKRDVFDIKIAAMNLPHFLDYIGDGTLVITPGDRSDVILGSLAATVSETYPNISGLLLTGGLSLEPQVQRLIKGSKKTSPIPIFSVDTDTYATAIKAESVRAALTPQNERKIASALGLFEAHVDIAEIEDRIKVVRSTSVTPIMFEYNLIERAKARRQHIVLPEGSERRILEACEILLRRQVVDITLLGNPEDIRRKISGLGLNLENIKIIDPMKSELLEEYAMIYYGMRKHKGISEKMAGDTVTDVSFFGTMMVYKGAPTAWYPVLFTPPAKPYGRPFRSFAPEPGLPLSPVYF